MRKWNGKLHHRWCGPNPIPEGANTGQEELNDNDVS